MASIENRVFFLCVINWIYAEYPISFSFKLLLIPIFLYAQQEGDFFLSLNPLYAQVLLPFNLQTCQGKGQDDSSLRDPEETVDMQKEILWQIVSQDILDAICFAL